MKKIVAFILAFMYLGLSSGLAVNIHYCMGKIADVQLDNYKETSCKCDKQTKMPCCGHQYELVKVNDVHQQAATDVSINTPQVQLNTFNQLMALLYTPQLKATTSAFTIPPLLTPPDIYIQNSVFRI